MDLCTVAEVKAQLGITDTADDGWLGGTIIAVSAAFEAETHRWLAPRGTLIRLFDGPAIRDGGRVLPIPDGISTLTSLAVADGDRPDDGSGSYAPITRGIHLRGALREGWPATRIELDSTAGCVLPVAGYNAVRVVGSFGPAAVYPRVAQLAANAVSRCYRARSSGAADTAIVGLDGAMRILRDIAPAELAELVRDYAADTRPAFASVPVG